jgi:hypothetical protein
VLRGILIGVGLVCVVTALILLILGAIGPALSFTIFGGLILLGTLFERVRYKRLAPRVPPGAVRTDERFIDEESGKTVTVYVDPATGERTYVTE